jgi:hypothetical protein
MFRQKVRVQAARASHIHLYWSRTLLSFIGSRGFSKTGLDKIPAGTTRFFKECGNTAFLRDSEPPALSMAQSIKPCSKMTVQEKFF